MQVVQAHQGARMFFVFGLGVAQRLRGLQGGVEVLRGLGPRQHAAQAFAQPGLPGLALGVQPVGEGLAVVVAVVGQPGRHAVAGVGQVHLSGQLQAVPASQQRRPELLLEAQQLLAQVVPRVARIGPQPGRSALARESGLQRRQGAQGRRAALQQRGCATRRRYPGAAV